MASTVHKGWLTALGAALITVALAQPGVAATSQQSSLSKWLSQRAVPELRERLGRHPRYQDQRIAVVSGERDALSAAR